MLDLKALPVFRKNMRAFILADPVSVTLLRQVKIESDAGGFIKGPVTEVKVNNEPQTFRIVPFKRRLYDFTQRTMNGKIPVEQFALVGFWNCDVERDDEFLQGNNRYRVVSIEPQTQEDRTKTDRVVAMLEVQQENDEVVEI